MQPNVYVDGFNFYYGCVKRTPYKGLDLGAFCRALFPGDTINRIRYFTALVKSDPADPNRTVRQMAYLRALETVPNLSVHEGQFLKATKKGRLVAPPMRGVELVTVEVWEEKGSDVNIAAHLLADGFRGDFEQAVVISNDSDLVEPIRLVRSELNLPVGVLSPHRPGSKPSFHLQRVASFYRPVDRSLLGSCQFRPELADFRGRVIRKPAGW
jgi:hypothetical protein